jgi:hypothetical protein
MMSETFGQSEEVSFLGFDSSKKKKKKTSAMKDAVLYSPVKSYQYFSGTSCLLPIVNTQRSLHSHTYQKAVIIL